MTDYTLPSYAFVPGMNHHPTRHPDGHGFNRADFEPRSNRVSAWSSDPLWDYGFRLFNGGYYWEAHEVWEAFWVRAEGRVKVLIGCLIGVAASGVKARQGHFDIAARLLTRSRERMDAIGNEPVLQMEPWTLISWIETAMEAIVCPPSHHASVEMFRYIALLNPGNDS